MAHGNEPPIVNPSSIGYGIAMDKWKQERRRAIPDRAWLAIERLVELGMGLFVGWILWA